MTHEIVVVGAGYAGLGAAKRTAARLGSADVHVTLVNAVDRFVERVRLHQLASGQRLAELPLADLLAGTGVDLVVARVTGIDLRERRVRLDAAPHDLTYDTLVYALGSGSEVSTPGVWEHAFTVADASSALRLDARYSAAARTLGGESRMSCQTGLPMGLHAADAISAALTGRAPRPARIRYVWQNISLGRHDGVTQFTRADDSEIERAVLTGRASARFKEAVTRGTVFAMRHPGPWWPLRRRPLRQ